MVSQSGLGEDVRISAPLVLGGNVFGWTADEQTSFRLLDLFVDSGGLMIDTADVYSAWVPGHSGGESETVIGNWLRRNPGKREKVQIATKVGFFSGLAPAVIKEALEASLRRLATDRVDLYYQHTDDQKIPLADSLGAFDELMQQGKIGAIGLSQFTAERLEEAVAVSRTNGISVPAALQTWYNLLEREKLEGPLGDAAANAGIPVIPFYALANGFLAGKYRTKADLSKSVRGMRNADYLDNARAARVLAALDEIAAQTGASLASISLAWTMRQPGISGVLASATSLDQLHDLLKAQSLTLSDDQVAALDRASS